MKDPVRGKLAIRKVAGLDSDESLDRARAGTLKGCPYPLHIETLPSRALWAEREELEAWRAAYEGGVDLDEKRWLLYQRIHQLVGQYNRLPDFPKGHHIMRTRLLVTQRVTYAKGPKERLAEIEEHQRKIREKARG